MCTLAKNYDKSHNTSHTFHVSHDCYSKSCQARMNLCSQETSRKQLVGIYQAQEVYKGVAPLKVPLMGPTIHPVKTTKTENNGRGCITVRLTD